MQSMKPANWAKLARESREKITQACLNNAKKENAHKKVTEEFRKDFVKRFKSGKA